MPEYPTRTFPRDLTGIFASAFAGGAGPTGSDLTTAFASADVDLSLVVDGSKQERVISAFSVASPESKYRLAEELLMLLRNGGFFSNLAHREWKNRAHAGFRRAGFVLDGDGYEDWFVAQQPSPPRGEPTIATITRLIEQQAAVPTQAESPPVADAQSPDGSPRRAYSAGDAIGAATSEVAIERKEIFLVHGHDDSLRYEVENFIVRTTGKTPIVLMLEPSVGLTVIEKFERHADRSGYAVILMSDDDLGNARGPATHEPPVLNSRPRQNVVFEFGYFVGALGRGRVAALIRAGVESPSDIAGLVYISLDNEDWKTTLRRELRAATMPIID